MDVLKLKENLDNGTIDSLSYWIELKRIEKTVKTELASDELKKNALHKASSFGQKTFSYADAAVTLKISYEEEIDYVDDPILNGMKNRIEVAKNSLKMAEEAFNNELKTRSNWESAMEVIDAETGEACTCYPVRINKTARETIAVKL